ncbi:MAG: hypothetical protein H6702_24715 [Myxococcales bacterium]|nr:hypothetical protein [Myxococcales bacterium]
MIRTFYVFLLTGLLSLVLACGTTAEKQEQRYKRNMDTIEALLAKHPMMRSAVAGKLEGFKAEHDKISGDEEAKKNALLALNRRMEEYVKKLDPSLAPKTTTSQAGAKVTAPATAAMAPKSALGAPAQPLGQPVAPVSGKLGGPAPIGAPPAPMGGTPAPMGGTPMAPAGKLGGPAPVAPAKLGAPAPGTAPVSGKLGGR